MVTTLNRRKFLLGSSGISVAGLTGYTDHPKPSDAQQDEPHSRVNPGSVAVVTQHYLATEAGLEVLDAGGTAADAAVGIACTLSVVEPWFSSALGGGTWALYYDSETGEVTSVDGVGPVGSDATPEDYEERAEAHGMHQSVVPGAWDGWMLWLAEYGELDLETVLSPAITLAREGYPASPGMESWLESRSDRIEDRPHTRETYERNGDLVSAGDTVYQYDMADTFEALAAAYAEYRDDGRIEAIQAAREYFYRGPLAAAIVEFSDEHGGYFTRSDFEDFEAKIVDPISITYDESGAVQVYQNPPNSQGITQLLALNILKEYDLSEMNPDDADAVHVQAEAIKLAFADRYQHVGDPERVEVPVAELLDDEYAANQRDRIEMDSALEWPIDTGLSDSDADHTTTFHVVDQHGNAAAVTTSLGAQFLVIGDTGIHINNRMRMLALDDDNPNRLTPGYKVRHTSNPYLATRDGQPYILGGNTGVDTQPQGQTQQFVHVVEFGLDAQETIDRPRFETTAFPSTQYPYDVDNTLRLEDGFPPDAIDDLEARGHEVEVGGSFGTANMIVIDEEGNRQFGAESRSEVADGSVTQLE